MSISLRSTIILTPTYNEKNNIGPIVQQVFGLYPEISLLILDDNSPDGTAEEVKRLQSSFLNLHLLERKNNRGLGKSYLDGFKKVLADDRYEYVVMMDADGSHDPAEVAQMVKMLGEHGAVIGSRYVPGGRIENWRWKRKLLSRFANFYVRNILRMPLHDCTTGFIGMCRGALQKVDLSRICSEGFSFLVELKYHLFRADNKFCECPAVLRERREGQSKMSPQVIWESVKLPWRLRFRKI